MIEKAGIAAAPGIVMGKAFLYAEEDYIIPKYNIETEKIHQEISRFNVAIGKTKKELAGLQQKLLKELGKDRADFFNLHLLILEDPLLVVDVKEQIASLKRNAEWAIEVTLSKHIKKLSSVDDIYLSERVADLYDVGRRIMRHLLSKQKISLSKIPSESIVVAHDLAPSDTAGINKENIFGLVTDLGGSTSHTAILSRAIGIPAVVGMVDITKSVKTGDILLIDGNQGKVIINPSDEVLRTYKTAKNVYEKYSKTLLRLRGLSPVTTDKHKVKVLGNIEILDEIDAVLKNGGEGIGLFRTEFQYLSSDRMPTEETLYKVYADVVKRLKPFPVVFRTIDVGGDKILEIEDGKVEENNPFLGWRAIRFCLENEDIFRVQLRAIIRASIYGNAAVMIPMISSVQEIKQVKEIIEDIKKSFEKKGTKFDREMWVGSMIEIPSAALTADLIAKEVNFFSIGTNDLIQYTIAVDRNNQKIAYLYDNFHPAVLRLIKSVIEAGHRVDKPVFVCGEMAADPMACILLVGFGVNELSMTSSAIPEIKKIIRSISYKEAQEIADRVLKFDSSKAIKDYLRKFLLKRFPGIFEKIFKMYI